MIIEYLADDIVIYLIKRRIINIDDRDYYQYGAEVVLLNLINILVALVITIISGTWLHYLAFLFIFVPLRVSTGGYHAKTSTSCLIISTLLYVISIVMSEILHQKFNYSIAIIMVIISAISIYIMAPVEHKNNPLEESLRRKNRAISILLVSADSIIFFILEALKIEIASSVMTFIILAALLMIIGKVYNSFQVK